MTKDRITVLNALVQGALAHARPVSGNLYKYRAAKRWLFDQHVVLTSSEYEYFIKRVSERLGV